MRIVVTGATGLIGRALCRALAGAGHTVVGVGRRPGLVPAPIVTWDRLGEALRDAQAVVNLAGEPIAARRWTRAQKARIRDSRVLASASAVGWYGPRGDEPLDETAPPGSGFLAEVCQAWEAEAERAATLGVRVVRLRIGVVLAPDGGALARLLIPFRAGLGGPLGSGRQWMSWGHRDDDVGLVLAALGSDVWQGAVNATAPAPVTNRDFARTLGRVLGRPAVLPVPAIALRLALGEMASMLLTGQRVLPKVAEAHGYAFRYPALAAALESCVG